MFESKKKIQLWADCGDDYYYGINGEKVDYEIAVDFYHKAMKKKHPHATFMMGLCYELGRFVDQDSDFAQILYSEAVGYGDPDALERITSGNVFEPPAPVEEKDEVNNYIE
ncbi:MAG: hypothetical protein LBV41_09800 [Cytophagaceae bacterium]|jgi:TPR repeat protein|nr:hypothetical protein [Cytophagaceae bacterium]